MKHKDALCKVPDGSRLKGERWVVEYGQSGYPAILMDVPNPPRCLYGIGDKSILEGGLAVVGARKATPYGLSAAKRFAGLAAKRGIVIVSGGALGCDTQAHKAALSVGGKTVVVLGGGCDCLYPSCNQGLFQEVINAGGAVISEHTWDTPPLPRFFRTRNRIIAGLCRATLIVEAGLPSGTFSTADEALEANREVLVVPGAITSPTSLGANRLIYQGATPIVDDETFGDVLLSLFGILDLQIQNVQENKTDDAILAAINAEPMSLESLLLLGVNPYPEYELLTGITLHLARLESQGLIARFPDGRYGPARV